MLNIENISNIDEIKSFFNHSEKAANIILDLSQKFFIPKISKQLDSKKTRGYSGSSLIMFLIYLPFLGVATVAGLFKSGHANLSESQKDSYYRIKNNPLINWRRILFCFGKQFKKITIENGETDTQSVKCFIADDTDAPKTGRKMEFIGKIYSHVSNTWILGFKLLTLGYWDGKSFIPLDFSLHSEKGKNKKRPFGLLISDLKKRFSKKRPSDSFGFKRTSELTNSKIKNVVKMVKRAVKHGFMAEYVLVDKWFVSDFFIKSIRKIKQGAIHVLAMCKMDKRKYIYHSNEYTAKQLLQKLKGLKKRSRKINAWYIEVTVDYKGTPLKLFFSRYSKRGKWHLVISTNLQLSYNQAIEIYNIRWSIEVFFKEAKQYLQLGKSQSNDFDAQIADITITMIQYIMLACHKRFAVYETIGELFRQSRDQLLELSIANRLWLLFLSLQREILEILDIDINEAIEKILNQADYESLLLKFLKSLVAPETELQQPIIQYN